MKKSIYLFLTVLIFACVGSDVDNNPCIYLPLLETQATTEVTETSATLNGLINSESNNCNAIANSSEQGFVYSTTIQPTINDIVVNVNGSIINALIENIEPNTTYYIRTFITSALGSFYGNEVSFTTLVQQCDVVYLANNGITIKAYECANVGDVGIINGVEYTVVDRDMLDQMTDNQELLTKVCTTRVTDMNNLFICHEDFNQPIGNWDTSNVTNMTGLFYSECQGSQFNQDISQWNVDSVTNMSYMFGGSAGSGGVFNQPIGDWNVINVTDMSGMFESSRSFNQPIEDWNVSYVTNMERMFFLATSFNQELGGWDTIEVTNMQMMFYSATNFNQQSLGGWDVGNVTNMQMMFYSATNFNQSLAGWEVGNVTNMQMMFANTDFFNQDLTYWDVVNVTNCSSFSTNNSQWTEPKPNFINCDPN